MGKVGELTMQVEDLEMPFRGTRDDRSIRILKIQRQRKFPFLTHSPPQQIVIAQPPPMLTHARNDPHELVQIVDIGEDA